MTIDDKMAKAGRITDSEPPKHSEAEWKRLVHELQVHQVELETQNKELQEARQALEVSRNRYVDLYDFAPVGYLTLDEKGCILEINLSGAAMLGVERARLIGKPFAPHVNKTDVPLFFKHLKKCRAADTQLSTELLLHPKNGELLCAHLASIAVPDETGQGVVFRTTITDITKRKRAEQALQELHDALEIRVKARTEALDQANARLKHENQVRREAEEKLRALLEAAPDAILTTNEKGDILYANTQADAMFGYERSDIIRQNIEMLMPERFRSRHKTHRQKYIRDAETRFMGEGLPLFAQRKDGSAFPVEISLSPLRQGDEILVTCIVRDITQRKKNEAMLRTQARELEEKVREMDDFTHVVSHDLKEPLRGISAFSSILLEDYGARLDAEGLEHLQFLKISADRMQALIEDLLILSSIGRKDRHLLDTDLNKILSIVLEALAFSIEERHAEIVCTSALPVVCCDPTHIAEVFKNLLSNALKFNTKLRPKVEISAKDAGKFTLVSVKDNGIGIDARYVEKIFGLFERLHPQETFEGTGAGLAICKKAIEGYGGKIWLESQLGAGTTFFFTLPHNTAQAKGQNDA